MPFEDGCYTCSGTRALIGRVLAGAGEMRYTRVALGTGTLEEGQDPRTLTEPPGYTADGMIAGVSSPVDGV